MTNLFSARDFQVAIPPTWSYKCVVSFFERSSGGFSRSIVITQDFIEAPCSAEQYASQQTVQLEALLPHFSLHERTVINVLGAAWPQVTFSWVPPAPPPLTQRQVFIVEGQRAWTITGTTPRGELGSFEVTFREVVESFSMRTT